MHKSIAAVSLAISVLAMASGMLCLFIALVTSLTKTPLLALTSTYVQLAIAAFLSGVWFALIGLIYDMRDRSTDTN